MGNVERYHFFVGVDIAAETFTASWARRDAEPSKPRRFAQTPEG